MKDQQDPQGEPDGGAPGEGPGPQDAAPSQANAGAPAPEPVVEVVDPHEELKKKLAAAEARLRAVSKAYTDLEQDMDAFRRRMTHQADQRVERKTGEVVESFFEPIRNLKRSIEAGDADPASLLAGVKMVHQQFADVMNKLGLEEIPGVGANFDPNLHEALAVAPVTDKDQDGRVLMVHATGYRVGGKVLQPAQVIIGKYGEPTAEA